MSNSPPENVLLAAWRRILPRRREDPAVLSAEGAVLRTFAGIEAEAAEWETRLGGLPEHSVVGVQWANSPCWPALILALQRRRLIPLPLGPHLTAQDLEAPLALCGAAALVTGAGLHRRTGGRPWPGTEFLKLTSGTTGAPRMVRFQIRQLVADGENICATMGIGETDLNFAAIPISHSYGFSNLILPLLCQGTAMAVTDDRLPRALMSGLLATGATVFPGLPVFYDKLAGLGDVPALPRLRLCISAGAPLTSPVGYAFTRRFGLKIHNFYGSSECGGIGYDAGNEVRYEEGFLGRPLQGVEIAPVADGRIEVRSAAVADGYLPEEAAGALQPGAFIPGDLVRWADRGLYLAGRASDVINVAGRKFHPGEVEAQVAGFPGLRQAVVFGVPSALRGEEPVLCAVGDRLDAAALQRFCHERLSQWQMPRDFWIVPEIPSNDRGKISRRELAEAYLARGRGIY